MRYSTGGGLSPYIEDRRGEQPLLPPMGDDGLLRGVPGTPYEMHLYRDMMERRQAYKEGRPLPPKPSGMAAGAAAPQPSKGDPAAIEAEREQAVQRARDQKIAALARYAEKAPKDSIMFPDALKQALAAYSAGREIAAMRAPGGKQP